MGRQIILKPDGDIAVWSTIVDNFVYEGPCDGYIEMVSDEATLEINRRVHKIYRALKAGSPECVYPHNPLTYADACNIISSRLAEAKSLMNKSS